MRTTLDIDDAVLAAARAKARAEGTSLGRAVSELAKRGMAAAAPSVRDGFPLFSPVPGHVITDELVEQFRDDE